VTDTREPGEVAVVGDDRGVVLECKGREVSVGDKVAAGTGSGQQAGEQSIKGDDSMMSIDRPRRTPTIGTRVGGVARSAAAVAPSA
jgi:hypothetical protein